MKMQNETIETSPNSIDEPRHEDDLAMIVRFARLANAVAFAQRAFLDATHHPDHIKFRQLHYATFLIGATLYRGLRTAALASPMYGDKNHFAGLKDFIQRTREYEPVLKRIAESPAVTFDTDCDATYPLLQKYYLDVQNVSACCERWEPGHSYFPAVFAMDVDSFAEDVGHILDEDQFYDFTKTMLTAMCDRFLKGAQQFLAGLSRKAELNRQAFRNN